MATGFAQTDLLVLATLQAGPAHGYAIVEAIKARSDGHFDLPEGTVYPALHRLEKDGLLTSAWVPGGRRPRRTYSLSRSGLEALAAGKQDWAAYVTAFQSVLEEPV
jgi:DNA-binding PadR family transcriptional regulator